MAWTKVLSRMVCKPDKKTARGGGVRSTMAAMNRIWLTMTSSGWKRRDVETS